MRVSGYPCQKWRNFKHFSFILQGKSQLSNLQAFKCFPKSTCKIFEIFNTLWNFSSWFQAVLSRPTYFCDYFRAPPITEKRWAGFYENFLGLSLNFYRNQPAFSTVEWNFCKWAKFNNLFVEEEDGTFTLNKNVGIVTQGNGDFQFLHTSLKANKSK